MEHLPFLHDFPTKKLAFSSCISQLAIHGIHGRSLVKPVFPHFSPHQLQHLGNEAGGAGIRVTGCNGSKPQKDRNVMNIYIYLMYYNYTYNHDQEKNIFVNIGQKTWTCRECNYRSYCRWTKSFTSWWLLVAMNHCNFHGIIGFCPWYINHLPTGAGFLPWFHRWLVNLLRNCLWVFASLGMKDPGPFFEAAVDSIEQSVSAGKPLVRQGALFSEAPNFNDSIWFNMN